MGTLKQRAVSGLVVKTIVLMPVLLALATIGATVLIGRAAQGRTYSDVSLIPHRHVGLVLGCSKRLPDGRINLFFYKRIQAAAELYRAGKVDYLLVSGDNHIRAYDEATDMKNSLIEAGVPPEKIYCDFAGFRTLDSVVRAKDVFGQAEITIVSQDFHNRRAIFIAAHRGLDAIGFDAAEVDAYNSFKTRCREQLAKLETVVDVFLLNRQPRFLGTKVPVGLLGSAGGTGAFSAGPADSAPARAELTQELVAAAKERSHVRVRYVADYVRIPYPGGDVPADTGTCTDEIVRIYRKVGIDLQKEVHEDMLQYFNEYPRQRRWSLDHPDSNIDHRRVPNLMVFFRHHGDNLSITKNASDYLPGDLVAWNLGGGVTHIGMVIDEKGPSGRYMILHNIGQGPRIEDVLFDWQIIGHYRYYGPQQ